MIKTQIDRLSIGVIFIIANLFTMSSCSINGIFTKQFDIASEGSYNDSNIVSEIQFDNVIDIINYMNSGHLDTVEDILSGDYIQRDPIVEQLKVLLYLKKGLYDIAKACIDSINLDFCPVYPGDLPELVGKKVNYNNFNSNFSEDSRIIYLTKKYIKNEINSFILVKSLRERRSPLPTPPIYEGLVGITLSIIEEDLSEPHFAFNFVYPPVDQSPKSRNKFCREFTRAKLINKFIISLLLRDLDGIRFNVTKIEKVTQGFPNNKIRFLYSFGNWLLNRKNVDFTNKEETLFTSTTWKEKS